MWPRSALPGTEDAQDPFWSPDSRWIGFFAEGKLKKVPASGRSRPGCRSDGQRRARWDMGTRTIRSSSRTGADPIQRVAATGGQPTAATDPDSRTSQRIAILSFYPTAVISCTLVVARMAQNGLYVGSLDDKRKKRRRADRQQRRLCQRRDICCSREASTLFGQAFDAAHLKTSGQPFLVAEHAGRTSTFKSAISASRHRSHCLRWHALAERQSDLV